MVVRSLLPLALLVTAARAGAAAQPAPPRTAHAAPVVEQRLLDAARRNPDSFDAQYQLASFYVQRHKLQAALPYLQRARAMGVERPVQANVLSLPFGDGAFDLVLSMDV